MLYPVRTYENWPLRDRTLFAQTPLDLLEQYANTCQKSLPHKNLRKTRITSLRGMLIGTILMSRPELSGFSSGAGGGDAHQDCRFNVG